MWHVAGAIALETTAAQGFNASCLSQSARLVWPQADRADSTVNFSQEAPKLPRLDKMRITIPSERFALGAKLLEIRCCV